MEETENIDSTDKVTYTDKKIFTIDRSKKIHCKLLLFFMNDQKYDTSPKHPRKYLRKSKRVLDLLIFFIK